jgi:dTMP kinase
MDTVSPAPGKAFLPRETGIIMFISFEGIEGSGKTTQIQGVYDHLLQKGYDVIVTREPGGSKIGRQIRSILLDSKNKGLDPLAELLLYMADRAQHLNEIIKPGLSSGKMILCDRYYDATIAYQGYARGLDIDLISRLHGFAFADYKPDMTFLLDLPPQTGLERAWRQIENGQRTGTETRFEEEALDFHRRVREGYLALAQLEPRRFKIIDAAGPTEGVKKEIMAVLDSAINNPIEKR